MANSKTFIHLLRKYLLSAYYLLDIILEFCDISVNKTKSSVLEEAYILTKHIDILIGF